MLLQIAQRLKISLCGVPVLGDSLRDIQAAKSVHAQPVLVLTGKGQETLARETDLEQVLVFRDLATFSETLLAKGRS
jgi:D-glycero-D-manno-heptose 1,7-bisphosphate phosphatase